jgi:hypothetical protein
MLLLGQMRAYAPIVKSSSVASAVKCIVSLKSLAIQGKCAPLGQKIEKYLLFCRNFGYDDQIGIEASAKGAGSGFLKKGLCGTARHGRNRNCEARRDEAIRGPRTPCFSALGIVVSLGSCGRKKLRKTAAKRLKSFTRVNLCAGPYAICMPSS